MIYNRQDCCKDRLIGVSVFIKLGNKTVTDCGKFKDVKDFYEFDCKGEGSVIELNKVGEVGEWNIAEIANSSNLGGFLRANSLPRRKKTDLASQLACKKNRN